MSRPGSNGTPIKLRGVTKCFGTHTAVSSLDLDIPRGTVYGLLGPNGSGKTTTLRIIMGILLPDLGEVELLGGLPGVKQNARVGYLPEERGVYRKMKVEEFLVFLGEIRGLDRGEARRRAKEWLDRLDLGEWADKRTQTLSKGMQQKVQFIGTVLHDPEILIHLESQESAGLGSQGAEEEGAEGVGGRGVRGRRRLAFGSGGC